MPVLLYHGVTHAPFGGDRYEISAAGFREHLQTIASRGLRTAGLGEIWNEPSTAETARSVVITFDDGRMSDHEHAFPLLMEAGARAEFFVNTRTVGRPGFLGWDELRAMARAGMSIQSHGHDHAALPLLDRARLREQLARSKQLLEDGLGLPVEFFAVPYGLSSRRVMDAAREVGYRAVCTSWEWPARPGGQRVSRVAVTADTTRVELTELLARLPRPYLRRASRSLVLHLPKRFLLRFWPAKLGVQTLENPACPQPSE